MCIVAGLLLPDPLGPVFVALGVGLPGLVLQDSWRFAFFAWVAGRPHSSTTCSGRCCSSWFSLCCTPEGTAARRVACSSSVGLPHWLLCSERYRREFCHAQVRALWWLRAHHQISVRYLVENLSISGASQLRSYVLGAVAGLAAVGYVRASEILMGPFFVVLMGISQVAVPEASRVFHRNSGRLARFCFILGGLSGCGSRCVGVDPHDGLPPRSWARPTQGALDANCHNYFRRSPSRSPRPRSPLRPPPDCVPWVWHDAACGRS